ncbi:hypothetical protein C2E21_8863 [Chlorella sorokiniana]|uniref:Uncharacterized protein n=1 Tax=Chlorella sorokiniana TaxID=3076 RepID=A0A2P6TDJ2_CHLSO|nr:hypothetical protein C2E21_8863 [Chlorella sorokiniana]|eukprot:PRW20699.1 hypothetical protein C2E21_8863 [Chlorella sorokiniana]
MGDAAMQRVVGVRRCSRRPAGNDPAAAPLEEWTEVTVLTGDSCTVYRLPADSPALTWDAQSRSIFANGRPLAEVAAREEQHMALEVGGAAAPAAMLLPPHVPVESLAGVAVLNLMAVAAGAGVPWAANSIASKLSDDPTVIKPPAPKVKPQF